MINTIIKHKLRAWWITR